MTDQPAESADTTEPLELNVDEEKMEAWDEVKADYQVEPGGEEVSNAMDAAETSAGETEAEAEEEAAESARADRSDTSR